MKKKPKKKKKRSKKVKKRSKRVLYSKRKLKQLEDKVKDNVLVKIKSDWQKKALVNKKQ